MKIDSSHLALRFYPKEGWTREILEELFTLVEWNGWWDSEKRCKQPESTLDGYWVVCAGEIINEDELAQLAEGVHTWEGDYFQSDKPEFLEYVRQML